LDLASRYKKFKKHLKTGGSLYVIWRGIKYFIFLIKRYRDRLKRPPKNNSTITKGRLRVVYSFCGIDIFWNNHEVTNLPGLNIAINTLGLWTDSSKANWQILEKGEDFFKIKVTLNELPLNQLWTVKVKNEQEIEWRIDLDVEEWLRIDELRIVCLINSCYKIWMSNYLCGDFPSLDRYWHDIYLNNHPVSLVGARFSIGGQFLPSFTLESQDKNLFSLIQNTPLCAGSHIIGFRDVKPEEKNGYSPGCHHFFAGKINLFEDDYLLDIKIESLRQDYLKKASAKKARNRKK